MSRVWKSIPDDEQAALIVKGRELMAYLNWKELAAALDVNVSAIRDRLDPDFRERHRQYEMTWRSRNRDRNTTGGILFAQSHKIDRECIAARLAEIPPDTRTPAERLTGDPIPARSALARRRAFKRDWLAISPQERRENTQTAGSFGAWLRHGHTRRSPAWA